jgi:hypothetical protein
MKTQLNENQHKKENAPLKMLLDISISNCRYNPPCKELEAFLQEPCTFTNELGNMNSSRLISKLSSGDL